LAKKYVNEIIRLTDNEMINAMEIIREKLNFVVEPACASSLAALRGPLKDKLTNKNVALIACGSNISFKKYNCIINSK
jgi:threonine dehydratase